MPNLGPLAKALLRNKSYFKALALEPKPVKALAKAVPEAANPTLLKAITKWLPRRVSKLDTEPTGVKFDTGWPFQLNLRKEDQTLPGLFHELAHIRMRPEDPLLDVYKTDKVDAWLDPQQFVNTNRLPPQSGFDLVRDLAYRLIPEERMADEQSLYHTWNIRNLLSGQRPLPGMRGHIRRELPIRLREKTEVGDPVITRPPTNSLTKLLEDLQGPVQTKLRF